MPPQLEFKMISDPRAPEAAQMLDIFVDSFPSNERPPAETVLTRIERGIYSSIVAKVGNEVVAFSLLLPLRGSKYVLLDYTTVKNGLRGRGIGSKMMKCILSLEMVRGRKLVLEVEDPNFGSEPEVRKARIRFYRRFGARELAGVRYMLPPLDGTVPTEMVLMLIGASEKSMPRASVQALIRLIYQEDYHRGPEDGLLNSFLGEVPLVVDLI